MSHPTPATDLAAVFGALWFFVAIAGGLFITVAGPLLALSVVISLRGIRKELRTIAEQLSLPSHRL